MTDEDPRPQDARPAEDSLAEYRRKRDFTRTPEPAAAAPAPTARALGSAAATPAASAPSLDATDGARGRIYVIHKHDASQLHYDLRLELGGTLRSWAVPKGPSLDPSERRLAVQVEDHPLEYASFEGTIPEGEYGAGTVMVWDMGWWEPDEAWMKESKGHQVLAPEEALAKGDLKFILHGQKLQGSWALVQMKGRGAKNWLLIKHKDGYAQSGVDITAAAPDSALSGRSLQEIAAGAPPRPRQDEAAVGGGPDSSGP